MSDLIIVGGGLAGCEAAWQAAQRDVNVTLFEMRPKRMTPAHVTDRLAELEALVHPFVRERILHLIEEARRAHPAVVVLEAIKLIEAGYGPMCDEIWLVACEPAKQLARLLARGLTSAEARQRIQAQVEQARPWQEAAARVIRTDGSLDDTRLAVDAALVALTGPNRGTSRGSGPTGAASGS